MTDIMSREARSRLMSRVRSRDTAPERTVRSLLHRLGYRFRLHRKDLPGKPDIVLPRYKTVIFVHGCFWHGHDCPKGRLPKTNGEFWSNKIARNRQRDLEHEKALKQLGWSVLTVWECQLADTKHLESYLRQHLSEESRNALDRR
ncbi:MAG: DNA mismatch endonuclease Vsr [Rubrobacteraceae bacterium]|nr:DNA mismatch endonuclease Vsr [Rubrobacteraceae bacterium]